MIIQRVSPFRQNLRVSSRKKETIPKQRNCPLTFDSFRKNELTFCGKPEKLLAVGTYISTSGAVKAKDALYGFQKLAKAKYLDIPHTQWSGIQEINHRTIRRGNLEFLDRVTEPEEQAHFIKEYCLLTGFPNLKTVSNKILDVFENTAYKVSCDLRKHSPNPTKYQVVGLSYNQTCSVGKGIAFPGSDIDNAVIVIKGASGHENDQLVNRFREGLWNENDSRILSFNHNSAFPQVCTLERLEHVSKKFDEVADNIDLSPEHLAKTASPEYKEDYTAANKASIKLCGQFKDEESPYYNNISREEAKNFLFASEVLTSGRNIVVDPFNGDMGSWNGRIDEAFEGVRRFNALKSKSFSGDGLSSVITPSQIEALSKVKEDKPKIKKRRQLEKEFGTWSVEKQYAFIKNMIKASCGENDDPQFAEYFVPGPDRYTPFLMAIKNA